MIVNVGAHRLANERSQRARGVDASACPLYSLAVARVAWNVD